jgi:hypothetical protein
MRLCTRHEYVWLGNGVMRRNKCLIFLKKWQNKFLNEIIWRKNMNNVNRKMVGEE